MGNDFARGKQWLICQKYGQIFVQTDKDSYYPGDVITGKVYLNLHMFYPGNELWLKFKGKEFVHFVDQVTRERRRDDGTVEFYQEDIHRVHKARTITVRERLYLWPGLQIQVGQFVFPFQMKLPENLSGTFFQKRYRMLGDISYKIEAALTSNQFVPPLKYKHHLPINEYQKTVATQQNGQINVPVYNCCCLNKGRSQMTASFQKNEYTPGETAFVQFQIDNRGAQVNCNRVDFKLRQKIKLRTPTHQKESMFDLVVSQASGAQAGQLGETQQISLQLPPPEQVSLEELRFQGINLEAHLLENNDSSNCINPSTSGEFIKSEFFLELKADMDTICSCHTPPDIMIPIHIHTKPRPMVVLQQPVGWNPQVMPLFQMPMGQMSVQVNPNLGQMGQPQMGYQQQPQQMGYQQQPQQMGYQQQPQQMGYQQQPQMMNMGNNNLQQGLLQ